MKISPYIFALLISCTSSLTALADAVDIEISDGEGAVYILMDDGKIQFLGRAENFGVPQNVDAVDLTLTPSGNGYYVIEEDGTVHSFGDAVVFGQPVSTRVDVVDMELTANGFYFLREDGTIVTAGDAVFYGFFEHDDAVDLEMTNDGLGYYVLYDDGTIAFFGTALSQGFTTFRSDRAVDLEIVNDGYYVLVDDGSVLNFGAALPLPSVQNPSNDLVAMVLTNRGYRLLDDKGNAESFFRLDNQGTLDWFAQSNAVAPQQVNTPTPRPVTPTPTPRPTATPRSNAPILEIEESGFSASVAASFPAEVSIPTGMTTGQVSLTSGDTFIVTMPDGTGKASAIRLFKNNEFGRVNNDGGVFAQLNPDRGEAVIKGISFSQLGLIVTVEDVTGTQLLLITGPFEDSSVRNFSRF